MSRNKIFLFKAAPLLEPLEARPQYPLGAGEMGGAVPKCPVSVSCQGGDSLQPKAASWPRQVHPHI